jgi:hypothetical protein
MLILRIVMRGHKHAYFAYYYARSEEVYNILFILYIYTKVV